MSVNKVMFFTKFSKSFNFHTSEKNLNINVEGEFPESYPGNPPRNAHLTDNRGGFLEFCVDNALNRRYLNNIVSSYIEEHGYDAQLLISESLCIEVDVFEGDRIYKISASFFSIPNSTSTFFSVYTDKYVTLCHGYVGEVIQDVSDAADIVRRYCCDLDITACLQNIEQVKAIFD